MGNKQTSIASPSQNEPKISLKLIIHRERKKVIFAEADGHFADILFSFMTLPLGAIARVLAKQPNENVKPLPSLQNIYNSLMDLPDDYFSSEECKFLMLNPMSSSYDHCKSDFRLSIDDPENTNIFVCPLFCGSYFSTCNFARCCVCDRLMNSEKEKFVVDVYTQRVITNDYNVFVSKPTSFIVSDDLRVILYNSDSIIQLLSDHGVTDFSHIEEKTLDIGFEQIPTLLSLALKFKNPLTCLAFPSTNFIQDLCYPTAAIQVQDFVCNKIEKGSKGMTLNITLQRSTSRFLFAEADSDFVEFLFNFLEIPLVTLVGKIFNGSSSLHCVDNLYASISNLDGEKGWKSPYIKNMFLQTCVELKYPSSNQMFPLDYCNSPLFVVLSSRPIKFKDPRYEGKYLKSSAKFMLTDDLVIKPCTSSTPTVALLTRLKVPFNDVETHKVDIGYEEGLKILKASLNSVSTLTDSLLKKVAKTKK